MSNVLKIRMNEEKPKKITLRPIVTLQQEHPKEPQIDPNKLIREAEERLADAKAKVNQLIEEAKQQIEVEKVSFEQEKQSAFEAVKEEAFKQGFDEGYNEGKQKAEKEYESYLEEAIGLIRMAQSEKEKLIDQSDEEILQIALTSTEKILKHSLSEDHAAFRSLVKSAIDEAKGMPKLDLYIHPSDYEGILEYKSDLDALLGSHSKLMIFPNKDLERFSCIINTPNEQIDASLNTQISELNKKLTEMLEEAKRIESQSSPAMD